MIDINEKPTSLILKKKNLAILKHFDISLSQIGSITTENGANMLRTAEMLKESQIEKLLLPLAPTDFSNDDVDELIRKVLSGILIPVRFEAHTFQLDVL